MSRPQITCHILDTSSGRPAADVPVSLYYLSGGLNATSVSPSIIVGTGVTNSDGRVAAWDLSATKEPRAAEAITQHKGLPAGLYKIKFDTEQYFNSKNVDAFFPFVEVVFKVHQPTDEHYHIPLLLSNYSYSTYRGS